MELIIPTSIMLDKQRSLLYNFNAYRMAEIELTKLWGKRTTVPGVLGAMYGGSEGAINVLSERLSIAEILIILWAGLLHEDKNLTIDELGSTLYFGDLSAILTPIIDAVNGSKTPVKEENTPPIEDKTFLTSPL